MKKSLRLVAMLLLVAMVASTALVACAPTDDDVPVADLKQGTYRTFTSILPSNWNELTYQDNNDTQILSYIGSSFFEYDYKFDEAKGGKFNDDGTINADAIVPGSFTTNFSAATKLEDVTALVDKKWGYTDEQKQTGGYAWKITLREDLKWDDGTPIDASDFIYSMTEQLNPDFMNYRASTYFSNISIINAKNYFYHKTESTYESLPSQGYKSIAEAVAAGATVYFQPYTMFGGIEIYVDADGNTIPEYLAIDSTTVYANPDDPTDTFVGSEIASMYMAYIEVDGGYDAVVSVKNVHTDINSMDMVGLYSPSKYELVICMTEPIKMLKDDGTLSYLAAYYMSSLPLVKKDLYEQCKQKPAAGSTLWTTNYNSSLETSASWGPYKLASFQGGKSYSLVRNDNWFGYDLVQNRNQYNITKIECEVVEKLETQWMGFLSGKYDGIAIDTEHLEYVDSKYAVVNYGSTAYGIQIYSNLEVLKASGRNNGILAIQDFRQALSLSLDRAEFNKTVFGTLPPTYGLIGDGYYSDVENGVAYRHTPQAKKALLRTYGFTENENGTWTDGTHEYADFEKAYEAMNGYNPTKAKELLNKAITELTANKEKYGYDDTQKIQILYGATNASETSTKKLNFMQKLVDDLTKGTALEGKIEILMDTKYGSTWSDSFKAGSYELCIVAGIGGNIFNPFNTIGAFVDPNDSLKFSSWWDSSKENITFTMPEGDYEGAGETLTMSVVNWYHCLNNRAETQNQPYKYNWGEGFAPADARLEVLAMLEEYALAKFFSIQCSFDAEMALDGAKFSSVSDDYNTFMGYGGIRYNIVNYTDAEWDAFVKSNNGDLTKEYKKAE